jgi:hypothetical protein
LRCRAVWLRGCGGDGGVAVDLDRGHGWGMYGVFPALEESGVSWLVKKWL